MATNVIFARSGWHRVSELGKNKKDIDLELEQPSTGERAFVQVKSSASQAVLDDYIARYQDTGTFDRMFFVCHEVRGQLMSPNPLKNPSVAGPRVSPDRCPPWLAQLGLRQGGLILRSSKH